ncbi:CAAX amino terminal protease self- immunity [Thalassoglobus neptunius]|uniref:CAAX amino terminal protease self-immunity n=1 Tax=Thalassoglobus neptunius TaxID=1938619 RepID=A0A5C5WP05_9PLAN|nr:CPBP family intramembrane glutamic endopeptidase [Thalassoglobus neptunius]TWT51552.1 CAAX amino terminal protease self- immunity [Thalassoglobus neptunius]
MNEDLDNAPRPEHPEPSGEASVVNEKKPGSRPAGPGLPESLFWIFLFFVLQMVGMAGVIIAMLAVTLENFEQLEAFQFEEWYSGLSATERLTVVTAPAFICYLFLIPLGLWRMSPRPLRKLKMSPPSFGQVFVATSLVVPMTVIADSMMQLGETGWNQLVETIPGLELFQGTDVHEILGQFNNSNLLLAVFFIAVVPAVGEEFLFRGLIGQGLNRRWGVTIGVALTTLLFAAVHMYPPHVFAILPVGLTLHWVYLTTRSFWAPVLFHFLNNALATVLLRVDQDDLETPWFYLPVAVAYAIWCFYWLYQMRTRRVPVESVAMAEHTFDESTEQPGTSEQPQRYVLTSQTFAMPMILAALMLAFCGYDVIRVFLPQ